MLHREGVAASLMPEESLDLPVLHRRLGAHNEIRVVDAARLPVADRRTAERARHESDHRVGVAIGERAGERRGEPGASGRLVEVERLSRLHPLQVLGKLEDALGGDPVVRRERSPSGHVALPAEDEYLVFLRLGASIFRAAARWRGYKPSSRKQRDRQQQDFLCVHLSFLCLLFV